MGRVKALKCLLSLIIFFSWGKALYAQTSDPHEIVAEVNGTKITVGELNKALGADLYEMEKRVYLFKKSKIEEHIGKILLEKEAVKNKTTVREVIEKNVQKHVKKIKDKDVDTFYEQNKMHLSGPKDQYVERIRSFLAQEYYNESYQAYINKLKKKTDAKIYLKKPERFKVALFLTPAPQRGREDAKVQIIEFSDFECPFCSKLAETLTQINKKYGKKVNLVFKAYPLTRHTHAVLAHQAALCADDQKKFWPYHDTLFKHSQNLKREDLEKYAKDLKLDLETFRKCLDSGEKLSKVQKEIAEAEEAGVRSTPTLFVNGQMMVGAVSPEELEEVIQEELRR